MPADLKGDLKQSEAECDQLASQVDMTTADDQLEAEAANPTVRSTGGNDRLAEPTVSQQNRPE